MGVGGGWGVQQRCIRRGEGGGDGTPKFVLQKWPDKIFPTANVLFSRDGHFGLEGGGSRGGGGDPPASPAVHGHSNTSLGRRATRSLRASPSSSPMHRPLPRRGPRTCGRFVGQQRRPVQVQVQKVQQRRSLEGVAVLFGGGGQFGQRSHGAVRGQGLGTGTPIPRDSAAGAQDLPDLFDDAIEGNGSSCGRDKTGVLRRGPVTCGRWRTRACVAVPWGAVLRAVPCGVRPRGVWRGAVWREAAWRVAWGRAAWCVAWCVAWCAAVQCSASAHVSRKRSFPLLPSCRVLGCAAWLFSALEKHLQNTDTTCSLDLASPGLTWPHLKSYD